MKFFRPDFFGFREEMVSETVPWRCSETASTRSFPQRGVGLGVGGLEGSREKRVGGLISGGCMRAAGLSPQCDAGRPGDGGRAALAEQQQRLQAAGELTPEVCVDLVTDRKNQF